MLETMVPDPVNASSVISGGLVRTRPVAAIERRVLLCLAEEPLRASLAAELRSLRWKVSEASTAARMFTLLEQEPFATVLIDSWLPDLAADECRDELHAGFPDVEILLLDGTSAEKVYGAEGRLGPLRQELLYALRQVERRRAEIHEAPERVEQRKSPLANAQPAASAPARATPPRQARPLAPQSSAAGLLPEFVGGDAPLLEVERRIRLVAVRRTPVLIHGASGTGKELVARAIHRLSGREAGESGGRFVAINCGAIPEALIESELFGHARGAFTGAVQARPGRIEAAAGGTIFLDEVGELPLAAQCKLLRFLESGEIQRVGETEAIRVDVRVITATHRRLGAMVSEGTFRLDLLHRLAVFLIETPALAGRTGAIDALVDRHLATLAAEDPELPGVVPQLSPEARAQLHAHPWPGNVRELQHTLERAVILAAGAPMLHAECIDFGAALF